MIAEKTGRIVKGLGGLYESRVVEEDGTVSRISARAKGILHKDEEKLLVGDVVRLSEDTEVPNSVAVSAVLPRKNSLIRPPISNLDYIFVTFAAAKPEPVLETVDKLVAIAEHNGIEPVIIITKADVEPSAARRYAELYRAAGFSSFMTSASSGEGIAELKAFVSQNVRGGKTAAFAGASGVGKSSLMNLLFGGLALATAEISRKIERGRHTTRHVELFELEACAATTGFLADTPGFSMLDFTRFNFFGIDELEAAFRDVARYRGKCRYADCAHFGERKDECAVARAAERGELAESRLASYRAIYRALRDKASYN